MFKSSNGCSPQADTCKKIHNSGFSKPFCSILVFLIGLQAIQGYSEVFLEPRSLTGNRYQPGFFNTLYPFRLPSQYLRPMPGMEPQKRFDLGDESSRINRQMVTRNDGSSGDNGKSDNHQKVLVYRMFKRGAGSRQPVRMFGDLERSLESFLVGDEVEPQRRKRADEEPLE
eukprot:maker-scaffold630_size122347-snap-gene-0.12 protein:Tk08026 transcript:maker-scaffold630_size122347-snap-gene-0.12-mRNA-1 annotation:"trna uridine 5-carboxymethylaminomethyl modification protein"